MPLKTKHLFYSAWQAIQFWAEHRPTQLAIQTESHHLSWFQLELWVNGCASQLLKQGVKSGDVILALGRDELELVILYLASLRIQAVTCVVNRFPSLQLCQIAEQVGASFWFDATDKSVKPANLKEVGIDFSAKSLVVETDFNDFNELEPHLISSIVLSSGSTGSPKAIAHSTKAHFASAQEVTKLMLWTEKDNVLLNLPLYHVSGLALVWRWLYRGCTLSFGNLSSSFKHPITVTSMVMTQLKRYLEQANRLNRLKVLLGGGSMDHSLIEQAQQAGIVCYQGYAMTEMASTICAKAYDGRQGTGQLLPQRSLKIVDQQIWVKGECLALGTFERGTLIPLSLEQEWYNTKDLGIWHNGQLQILGRSDNQFISGGENIHCEEIENALVASGLASLAVVLPIADKEFGHRPIAIIFADKLPSSADIEDALTDKLIKFKWPDRYFLMPQWAMLGVKPNRKLITKWLQEEQGLDI